jgi:CelD/BcsL family acetyltransferase involved in cellulose biosynthesis
MEPARIARRDRAPLPRLVAAGTSPLHRLDGDLWVEVVGQGCELTSHGEAWDDLARNAAEPNPFLERWFLEPAVHAFGAGRDLRIAFVYRGSRRQDVAPGLVGLFPFERVRLSGFRARTLRLLEHDYCYLLTPLMREGHALETWQTVLDWAAREPSIDLVDLPLQRGEGCIAQSLVETLHSRNALSFTVAAHTRAMLHPAASADDYIAEALSGKQRHEYQRQHRRLAEQGKLDYRHLENAAEVGGWVSQFLTLESQGWKGEARTALDQTSSSRDFFGSVVTAAATAGRLQALGLWCGDRPIALKINFRSGSGSFAFKIAYDENYARQSPGVQLELENIRQLHADPTLAWMDSCAAPGHPMINRLWRERSIIQRTLISTGTLRGNLAAGLWPLARAGRRILTRRPREAQPSPTR